MGMSDSLEQKLKMKGSITVEAALCIPLFFLVVFSLFYQFNILFAVNQNQIKLSEAVGNYAVYGKKTDTITSALHGGNIIMWSENDGHKVCFMNYLMENPFVFGAVVKQRFYQQAVVNNYEGKSMCCDEDLGDEVYITETGSVYHTYSDCTYLNPSLVRVLTKDISNRRNLSGGKYKKCEYCFKKGHISKSYVYITDYGDRYHLSKKCSGIKRNIKKVRKSETGGMPECNKCRERRE